MVSTTNRKDYFIMDFKWFFRFYFVYLVLFKSNLCIISSTFPSTKLCLCSSTKVHYPLSHAYFFYKDRYTFSTDPYDNPLQDYPYLKKKNIGCPLQIAISLG